jgi:hypothetical protein
MYVDVVFMSDVQLDVTKLLRNTLRDPYIVLPPDDNYHGVIHWIGTDGFSHEWKNPYLTKKINVLAIDGHYLAGNSHTVTVTENLEVVVGKPGPNCLASYPSQPTHPYFTIDLGDRSVIMSHYRLFSSYGQGEFLDNFDISVSNDNTTWDLVQTHSDAKSAVPVLFACRNTKPFRYFRLSAVGAMVIGSIEIFGRLRARKST